MQQQQGGMADWNDGPDNSCTDPSQCVYAVARARGGGGQLTRGELTRLTAGYHFHFVVEIKLCSEQLELSQSVLVGLRDSATETV